MAESQENEPRRIESAAVQFDGKVYAGRRHAAIMCDIWRLFPDAKISQDQQGFLTNDGMFVNRFQAGAIAFTAGQTDSRRERLLSEHVWPNETEGA